MRSRALWRERADDPRTLLGWAVRDGGGAVRFAARQFRLAFVVLAAVSLARGDFVSGLLALALAVVPVGAVRAVESLRGMRDLPGRTKLTPRSLPVRDLVTLPPPATPYPCRVEVYRNGTLLGTDEAIVTFLDGWLHVEGRRTSFALRGADVFRRTGLRLDLVEGGLVEFAPQDWLVVGGHTETDLADRFRTAIGEWAREAAPPGESILPPATAHPTGAVRAWGKLGVCLLLVAFLAAIFGASGALAPVALAALQALADLRRVHRLALPAKALPAVE